ncbi:MAG: regulatory protein RecX [Gemmatimonadaceae bacterium]
MMTSGSEDGNRGGAGQRSRHRPGERSAFPAGRVTAIRSMNANGSRFLLSLGGVEGVVSSELVGEFTLAVGRELSDSEAAQLTAAAHRLRVFDVAVTLLAGRARSARDLKLALRRRGATDVEAKATIERLTELRLLDDAVYARELARSRVVTGGMSKRGVQQELARRGVAPAVAREAIGDVMEDVGFDEREAALAVGRKRLKSLSGLDAATARRRLYAFLARRGYDASLLSSVVASLVDASDDDQGVVDDD